MDSHEDEGAHTNISCWVLVGLSAAFLSARLYCKWLTRRKFWWDDYVLILAWATLASSIVLTSINVAHGFGRHIYELPVENLGKIGLYSTIASIPSILAAVWSKTSFVITLGRLMTDRWQRILLWTIGITINVFMTVLALLTFPRCTPAEKIWNPMIDGSCWPEGVYLNYGIFAGSYSAAADFFLALLPWPLVLKTQLSLREKIGVGVAMSMGLVAGATAIIKVTHLQLLSSGDFSYYGSGLVIWGTAESAVTIMAASVPMLRVLVRNIVPLTANLSRLSGRNMAPSKLTKRSSAGGLTSGTANGSGSARHYASGKSGIGVSTCGNSTVIVTGTVGEAAELDGVEMEEGPGRHKTSVSAKVKRLTQEKRTSAPDGSGKGDVGGEGEESPAASVSDNCRWANSETSILGPEADRDNQQHHRHERIVAATAADTGNKVTAGSSGGILATREVDVAYVNADRLEAQVSGDNNRGEADRERSEVRPGETAGDGEKRKKSRVLGRFRFK